MKLFFVDGIDKVTWRPIVFAVCTSEEKANAAKEALEKRGYGAKLRVVVSNLFWIRSGLEKKSSIYEKEKNYGINSQRCIKNGKYYE